MGVADRIMFLIYREADYARQFRVVYFTELNEHNKEAEIGRAMAGEPFYDGFIQERTKDAAKLVITDALRRLNSSEAVDPTELEARLAELDAS